MSAFEEVRAAVAGEGDGVAFGEEEGFGLSFFSSVLVSGFFEGSGFSTVISSISSSLFSSAAWASFAIGDGFGVGSNTVNTTGGCSTVAISLALASLITIFSSSVIGVIREFRFCRD